MSYKLKTEAGSRKTEVILKLKTVNIIIGINNQ